MDLSTPIGYETLEQILPHKHPMLLISRVTEYDIKNRTLTAETDIKDTDIFFDEKGVPSFVGFELLAQSICCLTGIEDAMNNRPPTPGMILSVVGLQTSVDYFTAGQTLQMRVVEDFCDKETHTFCYKCTLHDKQFLLEDDPKSSEVLSAKITVMETDDMVAFFSSH